MNTFVDLLINHRSVRKYKDVELTQEQTDSIISSAQAASTSSNVQAYSIIIVTDPEIKKELARLSGNQPQVEHSGLFLVFCGDLNRLKEATELHGEMFHHNTGNFIVATIDASLAAQNAAVAAEAMGLGICYIGGIRNNIQEVSELLHLPSLVYPVFGMAIGVPDEVNQLRPRLPVKAVVHLNAYDTDQASKGIQEYDEIMHEYYKERTQGKLLTDWSKGIAEKYSQPQRAHILPFLEAQGFRLK
ncbi:oxygen-insensitive NADPH nitroreductase [Paenibacillus periandrae]|uniref:oxygen-insensitive NADPH nitroreductase n=1 Tax=Paenibacillus periandrae TaxID=1761741 RepID=UPI001F08A1DF|nr:oxygen-insensitive NADPH nitroreductase [Paenibacillus periandrae]